VRLLAAVSGELEGLNVAALGSAGTYRQPDVTQRKGR